MDKNKTGLILGCFLALIHLVKVLLIALFGATNIKIFFDWVLSLHHITFQYSILSFNLLSAIMLLILAFVAGYILGWLFAAVSNLIKKK